MRADALGAGLGRMRGDRGRGGAILPSILPLRILPEIGGTFLIFWG